MFLAVRRNDLLQRVCELLDFLLLRGLLGLGGVGGLGRWLGWGSRRVGCAQSGGKARQRIQKGSRATRSWSRQRAPSSGGVSAGYVVLQDAT